MMFRCLFFFVFGIVIQLSHGIEFNVTKDGKLCLYANLELRFSVTYEDLDNQTQTAVFALADDANSTKSTCDAKHSMLMLNFGEGHAFSMSFSKIEEGYEADVVTFTYNLGDPVHFPNSKSKEPTVATGFPDIKNIGMDTCYSCKSEDLIESGDVNITLWDVQMQAFISDGNKSSEISSCPADQPISSTTAAPNTTTTAAPNATTTTVTTTLAPNTTTLAPNTTTLAPNTTTLAPNTTTLAPNTTTLAPNTTTLAPNTTTMPVPTTTPVPTLPVPSTGNYSIGTENGTVCLLANFGLRIGIKGEEMNLDPNMANVSGSCGVNSSELTLASKKMTIRFTFTNDTKKFRLHDLNISVSTSSGHFSVENSSLNLWEASIGSSYMCNKEQTFNITDTLSIHTFSLHVQPFGVNKGVFSTAEECFLDSDLSFLVPIAVGVALSFLIILVLISYLIGRRKSRTGYQSV
ncbi:lysosome-associated membrane glycoprotein 2 isoform X2 [Simochromis diagramma]|uniref:lysosome-associated membrane glycoprotein 2 isoform X2 n=1 Tax=Simochromis diagramma TaxID=43689 RepID=UPI001A7E80A3|nr:lysosome-associated membrane glycoprotein 2 isoform X2 [Simochromis diagramma]